VGCCEESDFTACVGEGALLWASGRGSDDNNTTQGCRAEKACVRVCGCESLLGTSKGRGAGVRDSQRLSFVQGGLG
jgi:hypothetical protein